MAFTSEHPRWEQVYTLLTRLQPDEVVTYEQLTAILGREFTLDRSPLYDAARHLRRNGSRSLVNVRGVGYRVIHAHEHADTARHHRLKARRQITRSRDELVSADRTALDPETARRFDAQAAQLDTLAAMTRHNSKRLERLEEAAKRETRRRKEETAELEERVARLEKAVRPSLADF